MTRPYDLHNLSFSSAFICGSNLKTIDNHINIRYS